MSSPAPVYQISKLTYFSNFLFLFIGLVYPLIQTYKAGKLYIQKKEEYEIVQKFQELQERKKKEQQTSTTSPSIIDFETPERQQQLWKEEQLEILERHHKKWLAYWIIYTAIYVFEYLFNDILYYKFPIYFELKLILIAFLVISKDICVKFFDKFVITLMYWDNLEQDIESVLSYTRAKLYGHVFKYVESGKDVGLAVGMNLYSNVKQILATSSTTTTNNSNGQ
ncbi:hypothetical protein ABK040_004510 [Willaertia magna]